MDLKQVTSFEKLFRDYFGPLCGYAMKYIKDLDDAKNIVHDVFIKHWEQYESLDGTFNHKGYLYTAVRNRCLNFIRDTKKMVAFDADLQHPTSSQSHIEEHELSLAIEEGIAELPEKCREVFELSRFEDLKYAEIAEKLHISVKTVEGQISKALRLLRSHLGEFLSFIILLIKA